MSAENPILGTTILRKEMARNNRKMSFELNFLQFLGSENFYSENFKRSRRDILFLKKIALINLESEGFVWNTKLILKPFQKWPRGIICEFKALRN